jgi:hypothetical protein
MFKRLVQAQREHLERNGQSREQRAERRRRFVEEQDVKAAGWARARRERRAAAEANPGVGRRAWRAFNRAAEAQARGVPVEIDGDHLVYRGQREPLAGVRATVSAAGSVRSRPTATRFVAFSVMPGVPGLAALVAQKKIDDRELFLVIDGPDWQWAVKADPKRAASVHAFAAQINTAARKS